MVINGHKMAINCRGGSRYVEGYLGLFSKSQPCRVSGGSRVQWSNNLGHIGALQGKQKLGDFLFFSEYVIVFFGFFGVYIFPKWLIKVPGHFGIFFR